MAGKSRRRRDRIRLPGDDVSVRVGEQRTTLHGSVAVAEVYQQGGRRHVASFSRIDGGPVRHSADISC